MAELTPREQVLLEALKQVCAKHGESMSAALTTAAIKLGYHKLTPHFIPNPN